MKLRIRVHDRTGELPDAVYVANAPDDEPESLSRSAAIERFVFDHQLPPPPSRHRRRLVATVEAEG